MALQWVEGFEGFGTSIGSAPQPAGIVGRKYIVADEASRHRIYAGRIGGYSLRLGHSNGWFKRTGTSTDPTICMGFAFKVDYLPATDARFVYFYDPSYAMGLTLNWNGTLSVDRGTSVLGTTSNALLSGVWYYIEIKFVNHNTTGSYELRVNGDNWLSASGIDTAVGAGGYYDSWAVSGGVNTTPFYFDDLYIVDSTGSINNDFLGNSKVVALRPDAAGDDTDWTPSAGANYAAVDEVSLDDDTTYVETSTANDKDLYNVGSLSDVDLVMGMQIVTDVRVTDAQSWDLNTLIKSGTTEDAGPTLGITSTSYLTKSRVSETNPDTTNPWAVSEVNSAQFGIKAT